jgi:hypothetical protein
MRPAGAPQRQYSPDFANHRSQKREEKTGRHMASPGRPRSSPGELPFKVNRHSFGARRWVGVEILNDRAAKNLTQ